MVSLDSTYPPFSDFPRLVLTWCMVISLSGQNGPSPPSWGLGRSVQFLSPDIKLPPILHFLFSSSFLSHLPFFLLLTWLTRNFLFKLSGKVENIPVGIIYYHQFENILVRLYLFWILELPDIFFGWPVIMGITFTPPTSLSGCST